MESRNQRLIATSFVTALGFGLASSSACSSGEKGSNPGNDASAGTGGAGPGSGGGSGIAPGGGGVSPNAGGAGGRSQVGGATSAGGTAPNAGGTSPNAGGTAPNAGGATPGGGGSGTGGAPTAGCRAPVPNANPGVTCHGTAPPALQLTPVVTSGLTRPVFLTHAPGDSERLFVLEQAGYIRVIRNGTLETAPFLDIDAVVRSGGAAGEQGLLGLAFHPNYAQNGRFFVNYIGLGGNGEHILAEYSGTPGQPANAGSARILSTDSHPSFIGNHNGGMLAFSPNDGCLYMSLGDGGDGDDPRDNGQNLQEPLGSILRYDVDNHPAPAPGNMTGGGAEPRLWDYGLRNPWRFSFDRATGDLYIGDVGQGAWEEVDVEPAGTGRRNYGWKIMEGTHCRPGGPGSCDESGLTLPAAEQENGSTPNQAVIGGYVYRGTRIPGLVGRYLYGDHNSRRIWTFTYAGETNGQPDVCDVADLSITPDGGITSFGEDGAGELYVLTLQGKVFRIDPG